MSAPNSPKSPSKAAVSPSPSPSPSMTSPRVNFQQVLLQPLDFERKFDTRLRSDAVPHAPVRNGNRLLPHERKLALKNALRYIPAHHHEALAKEFLTELDMYGHIYMYRFRPTNYEMRAYPIDWYPSKSRQGIMLMIMNNLDPKVAQYPHELVTYGGNGSVFSNWLQFRLVMRYLADMSDEQTLVMYSGHPLGLFPSAKHAPRVIVTNGMVVPNYSTRADYDRMYAMGTSQYGQMTAGSYCYIGPQGIVHGTTITLMNAARSYLNAQSHEDMRGKVFVSAGLGGMSGAQPKAGKVAGMIAVIAEADEAAWNKRYVQGWIEEKETDLETVVRKIKEAKREKRATSIGWLGNVVDLWERLAKEPENIVDLGSDQTSLHNPFQGGYYPVTLSFKDARKMMVDDPEKFKAEVYASLRRHVAAVNKLTAKGMRFWDYGNAFMLEASRAGADIMNAKGTGFRYASYFEDFMGDIFSLGFGPFRWVCTSGLHEDLITSDRIAQEVLERLMANTKDPRVLQQYADNLEWIRSVEQHKLVVGSEARILYSNAEGRVAIAEAFSEAITSKRIRAPIMLSRDHHDVSGTDSPYRETSNVTDGSKFCADMAVQNAIGDAFRGATSVSLHNGGGTGWGEAMNGGFLMLLEGTEDSRKRARSMLSWDVNNGVSRRAWSGNANAQYQIQEAMKVDPLLKVTLATVADDAVLDRALAVAAGGESPQRKRGSEAAGASASGPNKKAAM